MSDIERIKIDSDLVILHLGPKLDLGPLPSVFYFATRAEETLNTDPFNQPLRYLSPYVRIFSLTLPHHELDFKNGLSGWIDDILKKEDFISPFIEKLKISIDHLINMKLVLPDKIAFMGLSRGSFIALHAASQIKTIEQIILFSPLIDLDCLEELKEIDQDLFKCFSLDNFIYDLMDRSIRFYIGNCDRRVDTQRCFDFVQKLSRAFYLKNKKYADIELFITRSNGHLGHGTSPQTFKEGALHLLQNIRRSSGEQSI